MISAIYIIYLAEKQESNEFSQIELLVNRRYHQTLPHDEIILQNFHNLMTNLPSSEQVPVLYYDNLSYIYMRCSNGIILLAVSNRNIDVMSAVMFLNQFHLILVHYLCNSKLNIGNKSAPKSLDRDTIIDNITLILELLDECLDYGLLQITDYKLLEEYIKVLPNIPKIDGLTDKYDTSDSDDSSDEDEPKKETKKSKSKTKIGKNKKGSKKEIKSTRNQAIKTDVIENEQTNMINSSILRTYSSAINWRPKGIFYAKNEIFIDIIEDCEFVYDLGTGVIKCNEIYGTCVVKSYLSGMPVCRLGFNERNLSRIEDDQEEESLGIPENQLNLLKEDQNEDDDEEEGEGDQETNGEETEILEHIPEFPASEALTDKKQKHKIPIRNIQFHQCIELSKIYKENIVTFIPPDDKFVLMTYNVEQQKQKKKAPLIMIKPQFRAIKETGKLQIMCTINTNFHRRRHCKNLIIRIPINPHYFDLDANDNDLKYKAELGEVSFKIDSFELIWKIDSIDGKKMVRMMTELALVNTEEVSEQRISDYLSRRATASSVVGTDEQNSTDTAEDTREELDKFYGVNGKTTSSTQKMSLKFKSSVFNDDIKVHFKLPMVTYSGLKLSYLSVEEEQMKYPCFPWVRYLTKSIDHYEPSIALENQKFSGRCCDYRFKLSSNCFVVA
ncbi:hypothetical protein MGI_01453 [Candida albicans P75016]|nr:hypothetical protein MGI_01453 [Candida albicans P75016]